MDEHLRRIVGLSDSWLACKLRVTRSYGEEMVAAAERIARAQCPGWFAAEAPLESRAEVDNGPAESSAKASVVHVRVPRLDIGPIQVEPLKLDVQLAAPQRPEPRRGRWPADTVLLTTAAALALAVLFPPFQAGVQGIDIHLGHGFLFAPPQRGSVAGHVNVPLLACELAVVAVIGGLASLVGRFD